MSEMFHAMFLKGGGVLNHGDGQWEDMESYITHLKKFIRWDLSSRHQITSVYFFRFCFASFKSAI